MASPLKTGKQSVNLASSGVKVSRLRRDPPPKVMEKEVDPDTIDRRDVIIGVLAFALAIFVIVIAIGNNPRWSPNNYRIDIETSE
jgi:hypothetical protein